MTGIGEGLMKEDGKVDVKVSPLELKEKAKKVSACVMEASNTFEAFAGMVSGSDYYWLGEAGGYYRALYAEETKEMEEILKRLESYPEKVLQAAGLSLEEEKDPGKEALPGDVLS